VSREKIFRCVVSMHFSIIMLFNDMPSFPKNAPKLLELQITSVIIKIIKIKELMQA